MKKPDIISRLPNERDREIVSAHFGIDGDRKSLSEIGNSLDPKLTRQRVSQLLARIRKTLGAEAWDELQREYPEPVVEPTESDIIRIESKRRNSILKYLRSVDDASPLQYFLVHVKLGVPVPEHRLEASKHYSELESCLAFFEDYDARVFGRYRYCTKCETIKPVEGNFYRLSARGGYLWQICKSCNTKRQREYVSSHKASSAAE